MESSMGTIFVLWSVFCIILGMVNGLVLAQWLERQRARRASEPRG